MTVPMVYAAIAAITEKVGAEGIAKGRKNQQQGYSFRGIDDVFNALNPILAEHKLCILPCMLERACEERTTKNGGVLFYVTVKARFDFVSAEDGSKHEVVMYGEAMDSADKATNKAMSAAYKYAAMQAFCIPTEGDNDADATTHELAARKAEEQARQAGRQTARSAPANQSAGIELLSDKQIADINAMAAELKVDTAKICEAAMVKTLAEIPAKSYLSIIKKLELNRTNRKAA